jgi:hypothetical protein
MKPMPDLTVPRLPCTVCHGEGKTHHEAFEFEGHSYPERWDPCNACQGFGYFTPPDAGDIAKRIVTTRKARGKPAGSFRSSMTSPTIGRNPSEAERLEQINAERAYYVWRLARYHGGADMTMPWTATLFSRGDPYVPILDVMADKVAEKVYGTSFAAAAMWGPALFGSAYKGPDPLSLLIG